MGNSQNGQSTPENTYFTAGVGNTPEYLNTKEPLPNFDANPEVWQLEHNQRNIGSSAMSSAEFAPVDLGEAPKPEMGEIISIASPSSQQLLQDHGSNEVSETRDYSNIRTEGDHAAKTVLYETGRAERELDQTGNIAGFYEEVRNMVAANLKNSFGKELAA